jgi:thioesterase domain-containing protein/acyl carrier protein
VTEAAVLIHEEADDKRLIAYVESANRALDKKSLREFLEGRLPSFEVPADFIVLERLPRNPNGKVDRHALRSHVPAAPASVARVAPRDTVEQVLAEIWEETLHLESVGVTDDFFDLGGHSLAAVRVFSRIEKVFGQDLPIATLFESPTIEGLAARLNAQIATEYSCIVEIQKGSAAVPLFFVHGIGGNVVGFRDVARLLGPDQTVYGIQARGLIGNEPPDTSVEAMASHYVSAVRAVCPHGPYALAGLSFGGVVAFEMARQMKASGSEVAMLALLDAQALGAHRLLPPRAHIRRTAVSLTRRAVYHTTNLVRARGRARINYLAGRMRTLRRRTRSIVWRAGFRVRAALGRVDGPAALGPAVLPQRLRNVSESLTLAALRYIPEPYDGHAVLFRARETPRTFARDPAKGWYGLIGALSIRDVPGDHATMLREPGVRVLAGELRNCLDSARQSATRVSTGSFDANHGH